MCAETIQGPGLFDEYIRSLSCLNQDMILDTGYRQFVGLHAWFPKHILSGSFFYKHIYNTANIVKCYIDSYNSLYCI